MQKRGQSALEFLTTYGWAFLVILIMIGALSKMGIISPAKFLPKQCLFPAPIGTCLDSTVRSDGIIKLQIANNDRRAWVLTAYSAGSLKYGSTTCTAEDKTATWNIGSQWSPRTAKGITFNCVPSGIWTKGQTVKGTITISYQEAGASFPKNITGSFSGVCCDQ